MLAVSASVSVGVTERWLKTRPLAYIRRDFILIPARSH